MAKIVFLVMFLVLLVTPAVAQKSDTGFFWSDLNGEVCLYNFHINLPNGSFVSGTILCVESHSGTPIHLGYMGNGVFVYDDAGYIYPMSFFTSEHPDIREFNYGVF